MIQLLNNRERGFDNTLSQSFIILTKTSLSPWALFWSKFLTYPHYWILLKITLPESHSIIVLWNWKTTLVSQEFIYHVDYIFLGSSLSLWIFFIMFIIVVYVWEKAPHLLAQKEAPHLWAAPNSPILNRAKGPTYFCEWIVDLTYLFHFVSYIIIHSWRVLVIKC